MWNFFRLEWEHITTTGDDARPLQDPSRDYIHVPHTPLDSSVNSPTDDDSNSNTDAMHTAVSMPSLEQLASSGAGAPGADRSGARSEWSGAEDDERTPLRTAVTPPSQ